MKRILVLAGMTLIAVIALPLRVAATPISTTINLDTVFAGNTPDGTAPWLRAQFTSSVGSNTGTLVLTSLMTGPDFEQGLSNEKAVVGWAFYLNQALSSSGITCTVGTCAGNGALYSASGFNAGPVPGIFNLAFGWSPSGRFLGGDSATYALTFLSPLTGNPFVENASRWSSVAHVQGIAGNCSGWIVAGDGVGADGSGPCTGTLSVPEPGELGLFGLGLLLAGLFLGMKHARVPNAR
jgi:hypothetical protein